jgi:hypothetical protein
MLRLRNEWRCAPLIPSLSMTENREAAGESARSTQTLRPNKVWAGGRPGAAVLSGLRAMPGEMEILHFA